MGSTRARVRENCTATASDWSSVFFSTAVAAALPPTLAVTVSSHDTALLAWAQPQLNDCLFSRYQIQRGGRGQAIERYIYNVYTDYTYTSMIT